MTFNMQPYFNLHLREYLKTLAGCLLLLSSVYGHPAIKPNTVAQYKTIRRHDAIVFWDDVDCPYIFSLLPHISILKVQNHSSHHVSA